MNHLLATFAILITATLVLAAGIIMTRRPEQTLRSACDESLAWGSGFFVSYSAVILMLEGLPGR